MSTYHYRKTRFVLIPQKKTIEAQWVAGIHIYLCPTCPVTCDLFAQNWFRDDGLVLRFWRLGRRHPSFWWFNHRHGRQILRQRSERLRHEPQHRNLLPCIGRTVRLPDLFYIYTRSMVVFTATWLYNQPKWSLIWSEGSQGV